MAVQVIAVLVGALALLAVREIHLYYTHKAESHASLEDREVADLEAIWEMEWEWPV